MDPKSNPVEFRIHQGAFLILDKPSGISSQQAVSRVKRLLGVAKAGHTGTLDPFASGVLPVALNEATKACRFFLTEDKFYEAVMVLGVETDTLDHTGTVVASHDVRMVSRNRVLEESRKLVGAFLQRPPSYSAAKVKGRRLYRLARQGQPMEGTPRWVEVKRLDVLDFRPPEVAFRVFCSAGTYVRSLASQWGRLLGCGAHLNALRRLSCGCFDLDRAVTSERLAEAVEAGRQGSLLVPLNDALTAIPSVRVGEDWARRIRQGVQPLPEELGKRTWAGFREARFLKAVSEGNDLVAIMAPVYDDVNGTVERIRVLRVFNR